MLDMKEYRILNAFNATEAGQSPVPLTLEPVEFSVTLNKRILRIKGKYLSENTGKADYKQMREDEDFKQFEQDTQSLSGVKLGGMDQTSQKAFFLNLYNTLTIHALTVLVQEETTLLDLEKFWSKNAYKVDDYVFSLDDMEHGVLRGNQLHPSYKDYFFKETDPRRDFVQTLDPRIHFALNCGAKSCPPIRVFTVENMDNALNLATKGFCQNNVEVNAERSVVTLSKIFMWYGSDFGATHSDILRWITSYLEDDQKVALNEAIEHNAKVQFADYDWSIS